VGLNWAGDGGELPCLCPRHPAAQLDTRRRMDQGMDQQQADIFPAPLGAVVQPRTSVVGPHAAGGARLRPSI